jgi:AcrR family transcriptional regulator
LATLFRHFPTREALFEALLRTNLDALTQKAGELEASNPPDEALVPWFREGVAFVHSYSGQDGGELTLCSYRSFSNLRCSLDSSALSTGAPYDPANVFAALSARLAGTKPPLGLVALEDGHLALHK